MISASSDFITAVNKTSREFRARFMMANGAPLDCDIKNISCHKGSCDNELALGCVYAPYIEATLMRCEDAIDGQVVTYQVGLKTGDAYEYIDIGKYKIMDPSKGNGALTFTGIGTIGQVGNSAYSTSLTYPATLSAVINELSTTVNGMTGANVQTIGFPSSSLTSTIEKAITGQIRDALSVIASLLGGFVSEDNHGNIVIARYNSGGTFDIQPYRSLDIPEVRETPFEVLGVHVTVKEASEDEEGHPIPEEFFEYGNPVIFQTVEWMTQTIFNKMVQQFCGLSFDLATIGISLGDPRIEAWDVIALTDLAGDVYNVPCFSVTHIFDGGFTSEVQADISSTDTSGARVKGALEKYVETLDSNIYAASIAATQAKASAESAQESAETAHSMAQSATESAESALTASQQARSSAESAQAQATQASEQAANATRSANSALDQLSVVEDVIGVLTWASEHGTFTLTSDTTIQDGKVYFTYDSITGDYTPVVSPQASELNTYYELSVDEAMNSFIMSHLAVTARGLWVLPNGMGSAVSEQYAPNYKVLLSNTGMTVYDGNGAEVAVFGSDITFSQNRTHYIGNSNAFVAFDPAGNNGQGSLTIGGSSIQLGNRTLDDVLGKTLIYDHTYEYVRNSDNEPVSANFTAYVYRGGVDVKSEFTPADEYFSWYLKREDNNTGAIIEELIAVGATCSINLSECGYGAEVIGKFTIEDNATALDTEGNALADDEDNPISVRATGDTVRVRDLTVSTTIFPTDKIMVVGAENEHLVTMQTLQDYLNANLNKQVLFNTTAAWDAQVQLTSEANTLYIYTDHQYDSQGNKIAGIKVGDGNAYLIDMPFTDEVIMEHINDNVRHITAEERAFWNNKVSCYLADTDRVIFTTA